MRTAADYELERQELEAMLASGMFDRAPNLAHILRYVCAKYFEGQADQIKEYNIAVEALRRPVDFDQKRDSIVRVEAHRLRKRLKEFYEGDGADHAVHIEIPPGQYAPRFIAREPAAPLVPPAPEPEPEIPEPAIVPQPTRPPRPFNIYWAAAILVTATCGGGAVLLARHPFGSPGPSGGPPLRSRAAVLAPAGSEVRIRAGYFGGPYVDRFGRTWQSDRYFDGGGVFDATNHPIFGTRERRIYETRREGDFGYSIPLPRGEYELRLHFAETLYGEGNPAGGGETTRMFSVYINNVLALDYFDVIGDAGANEADIRVFKDVSPAADGKLHIKFEAHNNAAFVNAIEITPGVPGRMMPIRMAARDQAYTAPDGRVWSADWYASGGQLIARPDAVSGADDPELFRSERYGNLRYTIPVAPGKYAVTFYFSEAWFGPEKAAGGGEGSRIFDILCNGVALRRNFDIFKDSGGPNRAMKLTFHGLTPNAQRKLAISLVPVRNYACLNAIEVVEESD